MISTDHKIRVYYRDVDQMGIVYYSRYLEYFEAARTELLRKMGLNVRKIEDNGYYLPVLESHCRYLGSARFDDVLRIETFIPSTPRFKVRIGYNVTLEDSDTKIAEGFTLHVFTRQNDGKPCRVPEEYADCFQVQ